MRALRVTRTLARRPGGGDFNYVCEIISTAKRKSGDNDDDSDSDELHEYNNRVRAGRNAVLSPTCTLRVHVGPACCLSGEEQRERERERGSEERYRLNAPLTSR